MLGHRRDICWYCGGQLCWDNDHDLAGVYGDDDMQGQYTELHCMNCGAEVTYVIRADEEE